MLLHFSKFRATLLMFCLVFTSSASAYMHIGEHQHSQEAGLAHHHAAEDHQHSQQDSDPEHDQHFHVHLIGDLVSHPPLITNANLQASVQEISPRIHSRAYAPLIPPPNA